MRHRMKLATCRRKTSFGVAFRYSCVPVAQKGCRLKLSYVAFAAASAILAVDPSPAFVANGGQGAVESDVRSRVEVNGRVQSGRLIERMRHHEVPGVAIVVIRGGKVAWSAGYGTRLAGKQLAVSPDTPFRVASISKPVTGLLAVGLARAGMLDLDRDVNTYLRSWKLPNGAGVTPRRILSHTAGLSVSAFPYYHPRGPVPSVRDMLDGSSASRAVAVRVIDTPGAGFRYSGGGFLVLQQAIEDATGTPFALLAERELFRPLDMTRTTFALTPAPAYLASAAIGHRYGKPIEGGRTVTPNMAGEGLWTTARDLARYAVATREAWLGRRPDLLDRGAAVEMLTPAGFSDGTVGFMALGPGVLGQGRERRFAADGNGLGFRARLTMYLESGDGVIVLTNGDGGEGLLGEVSDAVARAYGWPVQPRPPVARRTRPVDREELARVAGTYVILANADTDAKTVRVVSAGGGLRVQAGNEAWWTYRPDAAGGFFHSDMNSRIRFVPGKDGRHTLELSHLGSDFPPAPRVN